MDQYIINPNTGKQIKVGGPTYQRLLKSGLDLANRQKYPVVNRRDSRNQVHDDIVDEELLSEIMEMDLYREPSISKLKKLAKAPYQKRKYEKLLKNEGKGRGSATRGWSLRAPKEGKQRQELMKKCGKKCFLGKEQGFPICPTCYLYEGDCQCLLDCEGVQSAFIRARQWKYPGIAKVAKQILKQKCNK